MDTVNVRLSRAVVAELQFKLEVVLDDAGLREGYEVTEAWVEALRSKLAPPAGTSAVYALDEGEHWVLFKELGNAYDIANDNWSQGDNPEYGPARRAFALGLKRLREAAEAAGWQL